jgi:hypothetical protein
VAPNPPFPHSFFHPYSSKWSRWCRVRVVGVHIEGVRRKGGSSDSIELTKFKTRRTFRDSLSDYWLQGRKTFTVPSMFATATPALLLLVTKYPVATLRGLFVEGLLVVA